MELLAPAGTPEALRAAVENGADAVYVGGTLYSARAQAGNFALEKLVTAVEYCHLRGVKLYVAVNTLIAPEEFQACCEYVGQIHDIGVDAVIVQDLGLARKLTELYPALAIHASTQMSLHSTMDVLAAKEMGIRRVVLARELTVEDIKEIRRTADLEVEVFVHGALCISYSGQCLMSSMIGGRSGNRGQCAQPCRLPWAVVDEDGQRQSMATTDGEYALSPKDRCLINDLQRLAAVGIDSLKIEGRMKRPEYVATVVRTYRTAINGGVVDEPVLKRIFQRGYTRAMIFERPDARMMSTRTPKHQGLQVGRIETVNKHRAKFVFSEQIGPGDGLSVETSRGPVGITWGQFAAPGSSHWVHLETPTYVGALVRLTKDCQLQELAQDSYRSGRYQRRIPIQLHAKLSAGVPLELTLQEADGFRLTVHSEKKAEQARQQSLDEERLGSQLLRLGDWPVEVTALQIDLAPNLMLPWSVINHTRQRLMERWREHRLSTLPTRVLHGQSRSPITRVRRSVGSDDTELALPRLEVMVAQLDQLAAAVAQKPDRIVYYGPIWDRNEEWRHQLLDEAVRTAQVHGITLSFGIDRIFRNNTMREYADWINTPGLAGIHVGSIGALRWIREWQESTGKTLQITTDSSLNVFNGNSAEALLSMGSDRVALSPELTLEQIRSGFGRISPRRLSLVVQGSQELMVTEHCVFRSGKGGCGGGSICQAQEHFLQDRKGYRFPLRFDRQCRMHIFNSRELSLLPWSAEIGERIHGLVLDGRLWSSDLFAHWIPAYRHVLNGGTASDFLITGEYTKGHLFRGVV